MTVTGVIITPDAMGPDDLVATARRLEQLGHRSIWIPDIYGREIYVTASWIFAHTSTIGVTTGIAHMYGRDPVASVQAARTLSELSGGRFVQGLGVSHPIAAEMRGDTWIDPVRKATTYLTAMRGEMPLRTPGSPAPVPVLLAAHGPKMLAVAAAHADGANTYCQPAEHTAKARQILGAEKSLNVVLPCCLTEDADVGRAAGRRALAIYLPLPAYQRQWRAHGFDESDWSGAGSDRLVDACVPWGDLDTVRSRINQHIDAGASGIVLRALDPDRSADSDWTLVEALAP